ncbi:hypothetical protein [Woodsholea maritima]|uniref:hypothetical protein n=1 Tax=Woodsholea maritima TaxID=240237 RepID=UPI00036218E8|nr:hypothetical protein [Woodsholea maritima]
MSELAAQTPSERAKDLIRLTARLTELLQQETVLFETKRPHEAIHLQDEKSRLATIYRRECQLAAKDRSRLAGLPLQLQSQLRENTQKLETALEANGLIADALRAVTEGMIMAVAEEAMRQKQANAGYGPRAGKVEGISALTINKSA